MLNAIKTSKTRGKSQKPKNGDDQGFKEIHIDEEVKISVTLSLERFCYSDQKEMDFPSSLSSTERAFIHRMAQSMGYTSKSKGKGSNRFLTIKKRGGSHKPRPNIRLELSQDSLKLIRSLLQRFPITIKDHTDMQPKTKRGTTLLGKHVAPYNGYDVSKASGRLNSGIPMVPQKRSTSEFDHFRRSLLVHESQRELLQLIRENQVILVVGDTGCGKTTQIPQFLLDECTKKGEPCRIICTQPRRLAAIAVAERVASERGEIVGQTVGYHIRLESRVSPRTVLTFCTTGVLLRTMMTGDTSLKNVTHVIVDEVHERDGLTDFLLTKMRLVLPKIPTLKLILSSAALDKELFVQYFGSCPVMQFKGRHFDIQELFLEDILQLTDFNNRTLRKRHEEKQRSLIPGAKKECLTKWSKAVENKSVEKIPVSDSSYTELSTSPERDRAESAHSKLDNNSGQLEPWLLKEMDSCLYDIFCYEDQNSFIQLFNLILNEGVNVDYKHSETGATALMVAAARGFLTQMEQLLTMGADIHIKSSNGWTAFDFAEHFHQTDAIDLLRSAIPLRKECMLEESSQARCESKELTTEEQEMLKLYHHSFDDELVDLDLIIHLLHYIFSTTSDGAVLIFLPGYDEIVTLKDRILCDKKFSTYPERYQLFTLHSSMQTVDQKKAMKNSPLGVRKIILSTNIAETSITINDVVFVIDSGKVKEKTFDMISRASMLKSVWISKASSLQRKGRAGRCQPGVCFHLFSRLRFNNMLEFQVPQLLRMPLQDLCLQTKLLAPSSCTVAEFLSQAPQPPPTHAIRNAVQMLKAMGAMDLNEDLTDLGYHLADLPIEPHLGKMVLCAVVLKCLDPILTIACTLAYRDPFLLPVQGSQKQAALQSRIRFTSNTFSDHMALLRAFQAWQKAHSDGCEKSFCEKNFLSQGIMEMILGMRTHLLGQLRAIGFVTARGGSDIRDVNLNSENWAVVKAALVAGMYPNLVHINQKTAQVSFLREKKVNFHPTSVLNQTQHKESSAKLGQPLHTDWLIYDEMSRGHRIASVRCCTLVTAITVAIFGGCAELNTSAPPEPAAMRQTESPVDDISSDSEAEDLAEIKVDDWLVFELDRQASIPVCELRQKWRNVFTKRTSSPSKPWTREDEDIIRTLVAVLAAEEQQAGLQQPTGIGQRPRPMLSEEGQQPPVKNSKGKSKQIPHDKIPVTSHLLHIKAQNREEPSMPKFELYDESNVSRNSSYSVNSGSPFDNPTSFFSEKVSKAVSPKWTAPSIRYFIMRCSSVRNIEDSQQRGIWSTSPNIETKLSKAFQENDLIILIFTVQGSGHFQGFAHMTSGISQKSCQDLGFMGMGGIFSVEWIHKESLSFQYTQHLYNSWNDNKKVQISRDGQELEPHVGSQLVLLWERKYK